MIAPNRGVVEFQDAFEAFRGDAWYLHRKENDAWYFSNIENLRKRIDHRAEHAPQPKIDAEMKESREMLGIMEQLRYNSLAHSPATRTRRSSRMRVKLQLVLCSDEGQEETVTDVITLNKNNRRIEQLGLTLAEAKQLLSTLQRHLLQHQVATFLDTRSTCAACGALLKMKAHASRSFRTLFGTFTLDSPRLEHCDCTRHKTPSFRPLSALLTPLCA